MRSIQRFIARVAKDVVNTTTDNKYAYRFLISTDGSMNDGEVDDGEALLEDDREEDKDEADKEEDDVVMEESDDEGGWIGFNGKDNKLQLSNENDSSDEEQDQKELL